MKLFEGIKKYGAMAAAFLLATIAAITFYFLLDRAAAVSAAIRGILNICRPFLYGGVMAYILLPLCRGLEQILGYRWKGKGVRPCAVVLTLVLVLLLLYAVTAVVAPQLVRNVMTLANLIPLRVTEVSNWLSEWLSGNQVLSNYLISYSDQISQWSRGWLTSDLLPWLQNMVGGVSGSLMSVARLGMNLLVGTVVCIYLLLGRKKFVRQGKLVLYAVCKPKLAERILDELHFADRAFGGFISGKIIDSAIIGAICFAFCTLTKMPQAALVSIIVGVTNVIPFFGPYIGAIPSALLILMTSPIQCLYFLVFIVVLQQIDGNILGPMILGESTGLSGFWVLFAILFFGGLFGFVGMLVGVPLFAVVYDILKKLIFAGLRRNGREQMAQDYQSDYPPPPPKKPRTLGRKGKSADPLQNPSKPCTINHYPPEDTPPEEPADSQSVT